MQATLDANALRDLTRAVNCLSKYGENMSIYATPETFALSATNSSLSAFCRIRYSHQFFSRYHIGDSPSTGFSAHESESILSATGQLITKSLLTVLKHKTVERTVSKCELSILDGSPAEHDDENNDTLESRLVVRLHCKHGVVKTHRIALLVQTSHVAPAIPDHFRQSRIVIESKALKDLLDHFPSAKGSRNDPKLDWRFSESEVSIKCYETAMDSKGKPQLATELAISADEFEAYALYTAPVVFQFHLREFHAAVAFAEGSPQPIQMGFTEVLEPLLITVDGDLLEAHFFIQTSMTRGHDDSSVRPRQVHNASGSIQRGKKRTINDETNVNSERSPAPQLQAVAGDRRKPMKVVNETDRASMARELNSPFVNAQTGADSMPPPSLPAIVVAQNLYSSTPQPQEPLFLPGSQLSQAAEDAIRASGLGIENMTAREFEAMLEGDGEEVVLEEQDSLDIFDVEMEPTQSDEAKKTFKPLFED